MGEVIAIISALLNIFRATFGAVRRVFKAFSRSRKLAKENENLKEENKRIIQEYETTIKRETEQIQKLENQQNAMKLKIRGLTYFKGNCPYCNSELEWNLPIRLSSFVSTHVQDGNPMEQTSRGTKEQTLRCQTCNRDFHADYRSQDVKEIPI